MIKLIKGIVEFRKKVQPGYRESFGKLATGQTPDALFIACSDSRVVPNTFASTNPGDLFVIRNVGNLIPSREKCDCKPYESELAAIEFAVNSLTVNDIIICGHSECGAMQALLNKNSLETSPGLKNWLQNADITLKAFLDGKAPDKSLSAHNQLSQLNVLMQMERIKALPEIAEKIMNNKLDIHGWWFDILHADVYAFENDQNKFVLIDEEEAHKIINKLDQK